jgi:hypothetical protein
VISFDPCRAKRGATNEPQTAFHLCDLRSLQDQRQPLRVSNVFAAQADGSTAAQDVQPGAVIAVDTIAIRITAKTQRRNSCH